MLIRKAERLFKEREDRERRFAEQYGHIRMPQMIEAWGSAVTTIGGSIFKQTRLGDYTFLHAVHDYALLFFGEEALKKQETLPIEKRHPALQWMYTYVESTQSPNHSRTGAGAAWLRFAFDLHTISDNAVLTDRLKERLLKYRSFQTARHELWTAALFIAAGFEINYEDESDSETKHPEFIAVDKSTGVSIAVEAKCRQRDGVLGFSSDRSKPLSEGIGVGNLLKKAYQKENGLPLCVVLNTNLPPQNGKLNLDYWLSDIQRELARLGRNGYDDPCPANLVLFYNDPSHYMVDEEIGRESDCLWLSDYFPEATKNPCEYMEEIRLRILKAQKQRLHPPLEVSD